MHPFFGVVCNTMSQWSGGVGPPPGQALRARTSECPSVHGRSKNVAKWYQTHQRNHSLDLRLDRFFSVFISLRQHGSCRWS